MRLTDDRVEPRIETLFFRLVGCSVLACILADVRNDVWRVHAGALFPWRHLPGIPLYSHAPLIVEWMAGAVGGVLLVAASKRRFAIVLSILATLMGLSQRFSNHRSLLLIVLIFALIGANMQGAHRPGLRLVRYQLVIVYAFSALNKIVHGFGSGDALVSLFGWSAGAAHFAAWIVIAGEIAIPLALVVRPNLGIAFAIVVHVTMAILLPEVWPFTLVMIAMALLFAGSAPRRLGCGDETR